VPLTPEDFTDALGLVDQIISCNAQLHGDLDGPRRLAMETTLAGRMNKLRWYLDAAEDA
jgi:hypothetical protein